MAKKRNPILTQAQAAALVRYQPQLDQLKALMGQAQENFASKVNEAVSGQQAVQGGVSRVAPALHKLVGDLGLNAASRGVTLTDDVAGLGSVANSIKAAVQLEGTGAANRLAQTDAFNMADLGNRYVQAAEGAVHAKRAARAGLESDIGKITDQVQSVLGQKGAFTTQTIESLTNAAAARALQRRGQNITRRGQTLADANADATRDETIRHNQATETTAATQAETAAAREKRLANAVTKGPKTTPKYGVKVRTPGEHATVRDAIDSASSFASSYKAQGTPRATVAKWLTQGRAAQTVEIDGKKVKVPAIPKSSSPLAASIALDLAYDGHISRANVEKLWQRGITLRGVGLKKQGGKARAKEQARKRRPSSGAADLSSIFW